MSLEGLRGFQELGLLNEVLKSKFIYTGTGTVPIFLVKEICVLKFEEVLFKKKNNWAPGSGPGSRIGKSLIHIQIYRIWIRNVKSVKE
jgi:hypothetical protein